MYWCVPAVSQDGLACHLSFGLKKHHHVLLACRANDALVSICLVLVVLDHGPRVDALGVGLGQARREHGLVHNVVQVDARLPVNPALLVHLGQNM